MEMIRLSSISILWLGLGLSVHDSFTLGGKYLILRMRIIKRMAAATVNCIKHSLT